MFDRFNTPRKERKLLVTALRAAYSTRKLELVKVAVDKAPTYHSWLRAQIPGLEVVGIPKPGEADGSMLQQRGQRERPPVETKTAKTCTTPFPSSANNRE